MLSSLLWVVLAQAMVCTPGETFLVCGCKQGMVTACEALYGQDAEWAVRLLEEVVGTLDALEQPARMAGKGDESGKKQLQAAAESLSQSLGSSEPPHCKGQKHHLISRRIAKKLSEHSTLKGLYPPRDPRFVTQAKDEQSHCGYQEWHRNVDEEVMRWLDRNPKATPEEFMGKLRELYGRPEMQARFPHGF